jgi:steroid delta-isomerase-like uncharacterized protein
MIEATTESERLALALVDVWNERRYSKIPDVVSDSFVMYDPAAPGGEVRGPDGLEAFIHGVVTGFPDFHVSVTELLSSDELVMYEATITMTHEGEFEGVPPTGRTVEFDEMSTVRIGDGEIDEHRTYFDQQSVRERLGLTSE